MTCDDDYKFFDITYTNVEILPIICIFYGQELNIDYISKGQYIYMCGPILPWAPTV